MAPLMTVFKVSIPETNRDFFDYQAGSVTACIGARVWVPFRNKTKLGVVIDCGPPARPDLKLKEISSVIDEKPLLSEAILALCRWMSTYYQSPLCQVIALALPKNLRRGDVATLPTSDYYELPSMPSDALARLSTRAKRLHQLIAFMEAYPSKMVHKKACLQAGFTTVHLTSLVDLGVLWHHSKIDSPMINIKTPSMPLKLNPEQLQATTTIRESLQDYHCFLLQGVTGSGKTEVYLQVIATVLAAGRQVLILVPEIGLTPQLLSRFSERFQEPMVVIHSDLNDKERERAWLWASSLQAKIVIGTRSAIFTPMKDLGLIVIDEEHDPSLKQMEGVRYSARDAALMRAHRANIPIILGSATPSLESLHNCVLKKYTLLRLNQKAMTTTPLHYQLVDLRNQSLQNGLADVTLSLINEHLMQENQVLVFINRRGFSPVLMCHQCGWIADCSACDSHLTFHREANRLICHHCGLTKATVFQCQACKGRELLPIGSGTQRIYEVLTSAFPTTAILRVDRDSVRKKDALNEHLNKIHAGDAQLIIGTQMLAKGHHFPRLTLVVVLDADNGFYNQDFRALERLGQLLTQVAGRAGRAEFPGQVVIQTHLPQHPLLTILIQEGYEAFADALLKLRQEATLPPYHYLAMLRAQGKNQMKVLEFMSTVKDHLNESNIVVMGPAPAPLARKAGEYRMQLLLKSSSRTKLSSALTQMREWLVVNKLGQNLRFNIDVDPMDLA